MFKYLEIFLLIWNFDWAIFIYHFVFLFFYLFWKHHEASFNFEHSQKLLRIKSQYENDMKFFIKKTKKGKQSKYLERNKISKKLNFKSIKLRTESNEN